MPGIYQNTVFQRAEAYGPLGLRIGDGHRPARHFHAPLPVAQVDSVTFVDNSDGTTWNVVVDGYTFTLLDNAAGISSATAAANNFISQINSHAQASQIVRATLNSAGVMYLTARSPGTAFTATAGADAVGTSTATRAAVTANNAGQNLSPGMPVFRPSAGTNPGLAQLPTAVTDIFLGIVQFRHEDAELENTAAGFSYPAGSQVPVDPDGKHVVTCTTACNPGDPVYVALTTGALSASGTGAQVSRVTVSDATPSDSVLFKITLRYDDTGETFDVPYLADSDSTTTEIRDGLGDYINSHLASAGFTSADVSTDAIDITGAAGRPFTVLVGNVAAELTATVGTAAGSFLLANARWESVAAAGNKAVMTHWVP